MFLQDDLFSSKKSVFMKNAEQRAGLEIFCRKSGFFWYSLPKSTKTTPKLYNLFTVWFPKELVGHDFHTLRSQNRAAFTSLPFQGYCELEGPVQTTVAYDHTCLLSRKGCLSATQSQRTSSVNGHKQLHENVIISYRLVWTRSYRTVPPDVPPLVHIGSSTRVPV